MVHWWKQCKTWVMMSRNGKGRAASRWRQIQQAQRHGLAGFRKLLVMFDANKASIAEKPNCGYCRRICIHQTILTSRYIHRTSYLAVCVKISETAKGTDSKSFRRRWPMNTSMPWPLMSCLKPHGVVVLLTYTNVSTFPLIINGINSKTPSNPLMVPTYTECTSEDVIDRISTALCESTHESEPKYLLPPIL